MKTEPWFRSFQGATLNCAVRRFTYSLPPTWADSLRDPTVHARLGPSSTPLSADWEKPPGLQGPALPAGLEGLHASLDDLLSSAAAGTLCVFELYIS